MSMQNRNPLKDYKHLLLLVYYPVYLLWFYYVEQVNLKPVHMIHTKMDDWIPFCEYFIIPYMLWFGYVAWGVLHMAFHSKQDFCKLSIFLYTGMTIFLLVSTFYPNGHNLRPHSLENQNLFTDLCLWLYETDTPTNLFPSIHVYNSLGIHFAIIHNEELKQNKPVRILSFVLMTSIILSTMFLKQHSVFDVGTAFLLAFFMHQLVYRRHGLRSSVTQKARNKVFLP